MNKGVVSLTDAKIGFEYTIVYVNINKTLKSKLYDLGIIEKSKIIPLYKSLFRGCVAYSIKGSVVALRNKDVKCVLVRES